MRMDRWGKIGSRGLVSVNSVSELCVLCGPTFVIVSSVKFAGWMPDPCGATRRDQRPGTSDQGLVRFRPRSETLAQPASARRPATNAARSATDPAA